MLITLYARKEPTTDTVARQMRLRGKLDTVLYEDAKCKRPMARFSWFQGRSPRRGQRSVMVNCCRWQLKWV